MNTNRHHGFRLPAEWEPQSSVMLIWPHEDTDWRPYLKEITEVYLQMADAITRHEALLITARNTEQVRTLLAERLTERQMRRVTLFACDSNDTWARDVAPISLVSDAQPKGSFQPIHLLDFCFNGWGGKFAAEKDNGINRQVYEAGLFHGTLENHKDFVLEGGSIESDGDHTLFTTTGCLTAAHRNQPLTKEDIDRRLRLPMPDAIYDDGDRLPATYANFLVINGAVLVPTYHQPEKDKAALGTIQEAFPGREIIGIDSRTIIRQHGSIHCLTMQLP